MSYLFEGGCVNGPHVPQCSGGFINGVYRTTGVVGKFIVHSLVSSHGFTIVSTYFFIDIALIYNIFIINIP